MLSYSCFCFQRLFLASLLSAKSKMFFSDQCCLYVLWIKPQNVWRSCFQRLFKKKTHWLWTPQRYSFIVLVRVWILFWDVFFFCPLCLKSSQCSFLLHSSPSVKELSDWIWPTNEIITVTTCVSQHFLAFTPLSIFSSRLISIIQSPPECRTFSNPGWAFEAFLHFTLVERTLD